MKQPDTYKEVRTFYHPNATVRVHIPDITPEERERRMAKIMESAAELVLSRRNKDEGK